MEEVSASRLNLWTTCRLKFFFRYVLQLAKPPTPALHLGKVDPFGPPAMEPGPVER